GPPQPGAGGPVDLSSPQAALQQLAAKIEPGNKGQVVAVEQAWSFAILELSDAFLKEILGADLSGPVPQLELLVKRPGLPGSPDQFVTKVRLVQIKRPERLAIADILTDWTQVPLKEGDLVFF
ncbi:MAG: hypothetical protein N2255_09855, partial [Kiritimatiellae bacterium]|nr:hypothetical protein [Kiritimatiellia bacterium]